MRSAIMVCLRCGASLKGAKKLVEGGCYAEGTLSGVPNYPKSGKRITFECPNCHAPQTRQEMHWFR
jgi:hypothetical protein